MLDKFNKWGPLTVLLVIVVVLLLVGGLANVIVTTGDANPYTYREFLDDLKWLALGLAAGVGAGKGFLTGARDLGLGINLPGEETDRMGAAQEVHSSDDVI